MRFESKAGTNVNKTILSWLRPGISLQNAYPVFITYGAQLVADGTVKAITLKARIVYNFLNTYMHLIPHGISQSDF